MLDYDCSQRFPLSMSTQAEDTSVIDYSDVASCPGAGTSSGLFVACLQLVLSFYSISQPKDRATRPTPSVEIEFRRSPKQDVCLLTKRIL